MKEIKSKFNIVLHKDYYIGGIDTYFAEKIKNKENHLWSGYRLGAYLNENWYLDGGRTYHEIVTQWYDFPDVEN